MPWAGVAAEAPRLGLVDNASIPIALDPSHSLLGGGAQRARAAFTATGSTTQLALWSSDGTACWCAALRSSGSSSIGSACPSVGAEAEVVGQDGWWAPHLIAAPHTVQCRRYGAEVFSSWSACTVSVDGTPASISAAALPRSHCIESCEGTHFVSSSKPRRTWRGATEVAACSSRRGALPPCDTL